MSSDFYRRRFWLIWSLVLGGVLAVGAFALAQHLTQQHLEQAGRRFMLLNSLRKHALVEYLETAKTELKFWSLNKTLQSQQAKLVDVWQTYTESQGAPANKLRQLYVTRNPYAPDGRRQLNDAGDGSRYSAFHASLHPMAKKFVTERGYYDFFLISPAGEVLYSVEKEADFATNLKTGPWRHSGLGQVYQGAMALAGDDAVVVSDMYAYGPSAYQPAMFMARAMKDAGGEILGVLAFQLPIQTIRSIMQFDAGMGESGETYLVGEDLLMRSDSRFSEESTVLKKKVRTLAAKRALQGERGIMIQEDYRGVMVLSAYDSQKFDGFRWAVLAEIDREEILNDAAQAHPQIAALMAIVFAAAIGSLWFLRPTDESVGEVPDTLAEADYPDLPG